MKCNCIQCVLSKLIGDAVNRRLEGQIKNDVIHSINSKTYTQYIRGISKGSRLR